MEVFAWGDKRYAAEMRIKVIDITVLKKVEKTIM